MADIKNDRDKLLQAAAVRVEPIPIPMDQVAGLPDRLDGIDGELTGINTEVAHLMNNSGDLIIRSSAMSLTSTSSVTLTAVRKNGTTGPVTWSLFAGVAVLVADGDNCTIDGSTVLAESITVKAQVGTKEAFATISKFGILSSEDRVDLTTQITGQLANSNVSGLGALALLNSVDLNTQTVGALNLGGGKLTGFGALASQSSVNGLTQVTNLGNLAYANSIAANQIGAGTLAAGVIYAGNIFATQVQAGSFVGKEFTGGTFTGSVFRTAASGSRISMNDTGYTDEISIYNSAGNAVLRLSGNSNRCFISGSGSGPALSITNFSSGNALNLSGGVSGSALGVEGLSLFQATSSSPTLALSNNSGPPLQLSTLAIPASSPTGSIGFHPTYGLMFVKDGVRYICTTTVLT